jgi:hypothetical protein
MPGSAARYVWPYRRMCWCCSARSFFPRCRPASSSAASDGHQHTSVAVWAHEAHICVMRWAVNLAAVWYKLTEVSDVLIHTHGCDVSQLLPLYMAQLPRRQSD